MRFAGRLLAAYRYDDRQLIAALDGMGRPKRYAYDNRRLARHTDINQLSFFTNTATTADAFMPGVTGGCMIAAWTTSPMNPA
jgi:hypothetical protein